MEKEVIMWMIGRLAFSSEIVLAAMIGVTWLSASIWSHKKRLRCFWLSFVLFSICRNIVYGFKSCKIGLIERKKK